MLEIVDDHDEGTYRAAYTVRFAEAGYVLHVFQKKSRHGIATPRRNDMRRLEKQKPRFNFFLNPYSDLRFTRCPKCQGKTRQRKLPLLIHVDPIQLFALNKTCRYCPDCDLLIAHQDEIETYLSAFFTQNKPKVIGNDYLVIGTLERLDWQKGIDSSVSVREMLDRLHDFRDVLKVELTGGWMPDGAKSRPKGIGDAAAEVAKSGGEA